MKNQLLLLAVSLFIGKTVSFSQELVIGGNMEDASKWTFWADGGAVDSTVVEHNFNFITDLPKGGSGGCLELKGYGQTSSFTYQKVKIVPGHKYSLDGLIKNISAESLTATWTELNLTKVKPTWKAKEDSSWFNYSKNSWSPAPYNSFDNMDGDFFSYGQLLWKKVLTGGKDSILTSKEFIVPTTEKVTDWYVVIKMGCWNTAGSETPTFDFLVDNISLVDLGVPSSVTHVDAKYNFSVFPNPSNGIVNIKSSSNSYLMKYDIYNVMGALIKSGNVTNQLDLTSLNKGAYIIKLGNNSSTEFHKLVLK